MLVIKAPNVAGAWRRAAAVVDREAGTFDVQTTRAGPAAVWPSPVTTVYDRPTERVLLDPVRDANPFFHLFEALWMLAGRDDATFLDQFVSDYSARFAEEGGVQHGAYGRRWRGWFRRKPYDSGYLGEVVDQLDEVVRLLRSNPADRQAVIQMWDPTADLGVPGLKDRPCNQQVLLRADRGELDMTVTCRSNDVVWGCYGANVVHFSVLQEYLAARIGLPVGRYWQVSNNWHVYLSTFERIDVEAAAANELRPYPPVRALVDDIDFFDEELDVFLSSDRLLDVYSEPGSEGAARNGFLREVATPMWRANELRRSGRRDEAIDLLRSQPTKYDWLVAGVEWLERRGRRAPDLYRKVAEKLTGVEGDSTARITTKHAALGTSYGEKKD